MNSLKRYTLYILNFIDILSSLISFAIAFFIRFEILKGNKIYFSRLDYLYFILTIIVAYYIVNFALLYKDDKFFNRNSLNEFISTFKMVIMTMVLVFFFFNFAKLNSIYSRFFEIIYTLVFIIVAYSLRLLTKKIILSKGYTTLNAAKVLLLTPYDNANDNINKINKSLDWRYKIVGLVITNKNIRNKDINNIPILANKEKMFEAKVLDAVDEIIIIPGKLKYETILEWMETFKTYGKIVHVEIPEYNLKNSFKTLDNVGHLAVVTYRALSPMSIRQRLFKRLLDIFLSLLLLPIYLLVFIFIKLFILFETPGPTLIKRVRIGKNNRRFYQYRFRIYRHDAKERINHKLSPYSFIGKIINFLHLDGLPMILNVLLGDMSFVGPKAPSLSKYLDMSVRERNILAIKPGIVGYWTGGIDYLKEIDDEEDYLQNWSIFKDISIICFCILRFISLRSLRIHGDTHHDEELSFAKYIKEKNIPITYKKELYQPKYNYLYLIIKRIFDIIFSLIGLILTSPIFLILILVIIADDGGNPFYIQERIGKNGKKINIYKFRSMRIDAGNLEELLTPKQLAQYKKEFKIETDPRITNIGNFIRRTSLDELPQLFNILYGNMSVVGPRPVLKEELFNNYQEEEIAKLLSIDPGLTGYWQAYARNNATYKTNKRQQMELTYIDKQSLLFDLKIILKTIITVINQDGAQ